MKDFEYKLLHNYTQQFLESSGYISETTGDYVKLSLSGKIVYLYLLGKMFESEDEFVISQSGLASKLNMDTKTTAKALLEMLEHGAISGEKRLNTERGFSHWCYSNVHFPLQLESGETSKHKTTAQSRKKVPERVRFEVLRRNKFCCSYCGKAAVDGWRLVVDHIHPVSKGGTNDIENLTSSCEKCNNGKGSSKL